MQTTLWWYITLLILTQVWLGTSPVNGQSAPYKKPATDKSLLAQITELRTQEPFVQEPFAADVGRWTTSTTARSSSSIEEGALHIRLAQGPSSDAAFTGLALQDFLLEVSAQHVAGSLDYTVALLFRIHDAETLYAFQVRSTGAYAVSKVSGGVPGYLVSQTPADAIRYGQGAINRLGVLADGTRLTFLVNGQVVHTLTDRAIRRGNIGLGASVFGEESTEVAFDDLAVWVVNATPSPVASPSPEPATPTPIPPPSPTPIPSSTPTPTRPLTLDALPFDWSRLEEDFVISNIRLVERTQPNSEATNLRVTFDVEATSDLGIFVYMANFYDAEGDFLNAATVKFELDPGAYGVTDMQGGWNRGAYGTATLDLPGSLLRVEKISFQRIF